MAPMAAKPQMHKKAIGYRYVCCFPHRVWHPPVRYCCTWRPHGHWVLKKVVVSYCCVNRVIWKRVWVADRWGCCGWHPHHYWGCCGWGWGHPWGWGGWYWHHSYANELNHLELLRLRASWPAAPVMPGAGPVPPPAVGYPPPPPGYPPLPPEGPRPSGH